MCGSARECAGKYQFFFLVRSASSLQVADAKVATKMSTPNKKQLDAKSGKLKAQLKRHAQSWHVCLTSDNNSPYNIPIYLLGPRFFKLGIGGNTP